MNSTLDDLKRDRDALYRVMGLPTDKRGSHRCTLPGHEDRHGSLSIHQNESGAWRFKCHGCNRGGSIIDAMMLMRGLDKTAAIGLLRGATPTASTASTTTSSTPSTPARTKLSAPPATERDIEDEVQRAKDFTEALAFDEAALAYLWKQRGISAAVAQAHGLGATDIRLDAGKVIGATWTMQVFGPDGNTWIGCKLHRDPPRPGQRKGAWLVKGGTGLYPRPEAQDLNPGDEIVFVEGELKGLCHISAGIKATSLTTGASAGWKPELATRFKGFHVVLDPDRQNTEAVATFIENAVEALAGVAASIRIAGRAEQ